jgi:phage baseplate assembly protein W
MANKSININYPFKDSPKGFFLDLNVTDTKAIKADLMHLILTNKGERLYLPDFGTDLRKHLFQPFDNITTGQIKEEISEAVKKYLPNLRITNVTLADATESEYGVVVKIEYIITEDVFETTDFVIINL